MVPKGFYKGKKILITGGLGMIGSALAIKLVKLGAEVTILDAELPRYGGNHFNIHPIKDKVEYIRGDIRDPAVVDFLVIEKDVIFNLAGQVDYNYSLKDPFLDNEINCKGHLVVLEACRKYNTDAKIVHAGSRMQYGKIVSNPVTEEHPTFPLSIYGVHKLAAEKYYLAYNLHYGMKTICFRFTNPYGVRSQMKHSNYSIVNWFIRQAIEGKEIPIFGDGEQERDYIFVGDLADALIMAASTDKTSGQIYNLGCGKPTKFKDMVKTVVEAAKSGKIVMKEWPKHWHNVETGGYYTDISKLKKDTGWTPTHSLEEGIDKTVKYYKKYWKYYW
tara:strand:+ start:5950 stop:6942 length:993 start_codon:yes stop_codon:yes gene_type:complete